jgi:hypothetical protein
VRHKLLSETHWSRTYFLSTKVLDAMAILIENKGGTAPARKVRRELLA